jgi:hypothetical protein
MCFPSVHMEGNPITKLGNLSEEKNSGSPDDLCLMTKIKRCHQYSETNVMHLSFNLLRIKNLYMLRALLTHPQEALHKRHLVYCVRVMSVGCYQGWSGTVEQLVSLY